MQSRVTVPTPTLLLIGVDIGTVPLPRPATQSHDLMGGRAGKRAGGAMQRVAKRL